MARITEELLRKRSEHNDGELSSLKEITLHQFNIEKIERLDVYCRNLEILYLQNNLISKIEGLGKLKCLKYLNLALNNITVLENLQGCESLEKLDLTVNFIWNPLDLNSLRCNAMLTELFLLGNPVDKIPNFREYAIIKLPQLRSLNGKEIERSDRISASQNIEVLEETMLSLRIDPIEVHPKCESPKTQGPEYIKTLQDDFNTRLVPHTPSTRVEAAEDVEKMKRSIQSSVKTAAENRDTITPLGSDGRILQRNEGKWKFWFAEAVEAIILNVEISKFLDSSFLNVEIHSSWIKVTIKGKILQLALDSLVRQQDALCERSHLTGRLMVTMMKAECTNSTNAADFVSKWKSSNSLSKLQQPELERSKVGNKVFQRLGITDIISPRKHHSITTVKVLPSDVDECDDEFRDDITVPPLI